MAYKIKSFIASDGERFSQIYGDDEDGRDENGFPLFYPTAFISRAIRLKTEHSTQKVYLEAIKRLCEWEKKQGIDLTVRFRQKAFLVNHEIDSLAAHLQAARRGKRGKTISAGKANTYINYVAYYLKWLADEVVTDSYDASFRAAIDHQDTKLKDKTTEKAGSKSAKAQEIRGKRLPQEAREQLIQLWSDPLANLYRRADVGSRVRNVVMLRALYETGMRRGELLSLKLGQFLQATGGETARLIIERNHHDEYDTRVNQPVAKTSGRIVPISDELEQQLLAYIETYRAEIPGVGFSDEDFIFVTHRGGRGQGKPLQISNLDQNLRSLIKIFPALHGVHPHLLRHDWNYRFSEEADRDGLKPHKEKEIRAILMGWTENSEMAVLYNQRHTQEQSLKIGVKVANDTKRKSHARLAGN